MCDNHFHLVAIRCKMKKGAAHGSARNIIGFTDKFSICYLARTSKNTVNSVTWNKTTGLCFEIEKAAYINDEEECCESCIFNGKLLLA